jgi:hypothetical protein
LASSIAVAEDVAFLARNFFRHLHTVYNDDMQRKVFWTTFGVLGIVADLALPFWWALGATIPLAWVSWWVAYRSGWF